MDGAKATLIIEVIQALCPYLKNMAAHTDNKVDDAIVNLICRLVGAKEKQA